MTANIISWIGVSTIVIFLLGIVTFIAVDSGFQMPDIFTFSKIQRSLNDTAERSGQRILYTKPDGTPVLNPCQDNYHRSVSQDVLADLQAEAAGYLMAGRITAKEGRDRIAKAMRHIGCHRNEDGRWERR